MVYASEGWAATILVCGPEDTIALVKDEAKPLPHFWKLPGGTKDQHETPEETAIRETEEETGIQLTKVCLLKEEDRRTHTMYFYGSYVESFDGLKERGDEGELVRLFTLKEIQDMMDFFPPHRKFLIGLGHLKR